jgi:hypothetical protein
VLLPTCQQLLQLVSALGHAITSHFNQIFSQLFVVVVAEWTFMHEVFVQVLQGLQGLCLLALLVLGFSWIAARSKRALSLLFSLLEAFHFLLNVVYFEREVKVGVHQLLPKVTSLLKCLL